MISGIGNPQWRFGVAAGSGIAGGGVVGGRKEKQWKRKVEEEGYGGEFIQLKV
jgi:hypothetical protein